MPKTAVRLARSAALAGALLSTAPAWAQATVPAETPVTSEDAPPAAAPEGRPLWEAGVAVLGANGPDYPAAGTRRGRSRSARRCRACAACRPPGSRGRWRRAPRPRPPTAGGPPAPRPAERPRTSRAYRPARWPGPTRGRWRAARPRGRRSGQGRRRHLASRDHTRSARQAGGGQRRVNVTAGLVPTLPLQSTASANTRTDVRPSDGATIVMSYGGLSSRPSRTTVSPSTR